MNEDWLVSEAKLTDEQLWQFAAQANAEKTGKETEVGHGDTMGYGSSR